MCRHHRVRYYLNCKNIYLGRLCGYTKEKEAGGCDVRGLEPSGLCTRPLGLSRASSNRLPNSAFTASRGHLSMSEFVMKYGRITCGIAINNIGLLEIVNLYKFDCTEKIDFGVNFFKPTTEFLYPWATRGPGTVYDIYIFTGDRNGKSWEARAWNARLYQEDSYSNGDIGGWCAPDGEANMQNLHYLTVDLGKKKRIAYIATQGMNYMRRLSLDLHRSIESKEVSFNCFKNSLIPISVCFFYHAFEFVIIPPI